jgi:hypothetical protein
VLSFEDAGLVSRENMLFITVNEEVKRKRAKGLNDGMVCTVVYTRLISHTMDLNRGVN